MLQETAIIRIDNKVNKPCSTFQHKNHSTRSETYIQEIHTVEVI